MPDLLTRNSAVPLERRDAKAKPQTFDADARTIEATIASTTPVRRRDARGEFLEILDPAGLDLESARGVSVLNSHNQDGLSAVIGVVEEAWIKGDKVRARIRFSERPDVRAFVDDIAAGVIRSLSVGYEVSEWREGVAGGQRTKTAVRWSAREVSFVPVPADPEARTRAHDDRAATNRAIRELAARTGASTAIADDLVDRAVYIEEARSAMFDDILSRGATRIVPSRDHRGYDDPTFFRDAVADALFCRVDPSHRPDAAARQFIGASTADIARACLQRAGASTTGLGGAGLVTRALHTTSDFPAVLANVLNKSLRAAYTAAPSGLKAVARQTAAVDFRAKNSISLDSTGFKLEPVSEAGEFRSGSMIDATESYRVSTFGRIFAISRQALVNDDLGAFGDISRRLGLAAAAFEADFLAGLLLANPAMADGKAVFHADHGNSAAGGAVLSLDALSAARLAMRKQTAPGGGLIAVTPKFLVVSAALETTAEKLLASLAPATVEAQNPFSGKLTLIVEPRLPDAAWYIAAAPAEIDGLEYSYLASAPGPQIESRAGFEVDGVETRVRLDFGAGFVDWRGWYRGA